MSAKLTLFFVTCIVCVIQCIGGTRRCPVVRVNNGRARRMQGGQLLRFTCASSFHLVGERYASCRSGRWDVDPPVCVKAGCQALVVEHAVPVSLHDGAWVSYFCAPGYQLQGPGAVYCDGVSWNGTAPSCVVSAAGAQLACSFEQGLCGWAQDELHDFDWKRWSGRTPSAFMFTGPSHDHTLGPNGAGSYMYLEATSRLENDTARLLSPVYSKDLARDGCFSFFYHMFGKSIGGLRVYQKPASLELAAMLALPTAVLQNYSLFERWGDLGDYWYGAVVDLKDMQDNFQVVLEGVRGASFTSDVAVDDVALLHGPACRTARDTAPTPPAFTAESCERRCGAAGAGGGCDCEIDCLAADTCCPDFFEYCIFQGLDSSTDWMPSSQGISVGARLPDKQPLVAATEPASSTASATAARPAATATARTTSAARQASAKPATVSTTTRLLSSTANTSRTPVTFTSSKSTPSTKRSTSAKLPTVAVKSKVTGRATPNATTSAPTSRTTTISARDAMKARVLNRMKQIRKKPESASRQSGAGWRWALGALALVVLVALGVLTLRGASGRVLLARLRARSQGHPEVRFLTAHEDD